MTKDIVADYQRRWAERDSALPTATGCWRGGKEPEELYGKSDIENGWNPDVVKGNAEKGIRGWERDDLAALEGKSIRASQEPSDFGGETRYYDTVKVPLRDEGGTIIGVMGIGRNVTEQRRMEDERKRLQSSLERERTLLLTLINSLPDMVYIKDREEPIHPRQSRYCGFHARRGSLRPGRQDRSRLLSRRDGGRVSGNGEGRDRGRQGPCEL